MDWNKPPVSDKPPQGPQLTDKGFQLVYFKLSHRRRFWRTIYTAPLGLALVFLPDINGIPGWAFALLTIGFAAIQAVYEYFKWQQEKREGLYQ